VRPYCASSSAGALQRVGIFAESVALRGAMRGVRAFARGRVAGRFARHRPFTADVQGLQRIDRAGVLAAGHHSILLLHAGIRGRVFHASEIERRSLISAEVRQIARCGFCLCRELQRRSGADRSGAGTYGLSVRGHQISADAVIGFRPRDVGLHHVLAGRRAGLDGAMNACDGRFFNAERIRRPCGRGQRARQQKNAKRCAQPHCVPPDVRTSRSD
jgi:hypothetical protein